MASRAVILRWLALVWIAVSGCTSAQLSARRKQGLPEWQALLLNGGGSPNVNYLSHVRHIREMYELLRGRGLEPALISVLASDGDLPFSDLAVSRPAAGGEAWLLDGTFLERPLGRPMRYVSTRMQGIAAEPATRKHLDEWFDGAAEALNPGDTLFVFVTDHGERGKTPEQGRITLWERESISVKELSALVGKLAPGVRVVTAMSQCYSGAFAEMAFRGDRPIGSTCGYFSTTADRGAYGCYPESTGKPDEGHAFALIHGFTRAPTLAGAHAEALIADRTPDVPLRTSDLYAARVVERVAAARGSSPEATVSALAATALAQGLEETSLIEQIAASFAIDVPRAQGELEALRSRLEGLRGRYADSAGVWTVALGELTQANLDAFLAAKPRWQSTIAPRALARIPFQELAPVQASFVGELGAFTAQRPGLRDRLRYGHNRRSAAQAAAFRSEVRVAALLRLRTLLFTLVGRHLLGTEGSPRERADFEALRRCEALALPLPPAPGQPLPHSDPFPSLASDERLVKVVAPTSFGAAFAEVPADLRAKAALPEGAVTVASVDANSPAQAAGVRPGDVLLGGAGQPVQDRGGMKLYLASRGPQADELDLLRAGARLTVRLGTQAASSAEARDLPAAGRSSLARLTPYTGQVATALAVRKPRLLFFWATWCTFCKHAVPELLALEKERGISIVSITDESPGVLEQFFLSWSKPFPGAIAIDADRRVNEALAVDGYPTFVLVDENGRVRMRSTGYRADSGLSLPGWSFTRR